MVRRTSQKIFQAIRRGEKLNNWFEVDVKGLRALQEGKDKTFIIRELVQNCWDENIKNCVLKISLLKDNIIKVFAEEILKSPPAEKTLLFP